jgi:hypothetical protein
MSREAPGTGGANSGTKRLVGLPLAWAATAVVVSLLQLANVIADLQTARRMGVELPAWRAAADGVSSAAMIILLFPLLRRLGRATPPWALPPLRVAALHAAGWTAFALTYLLGFSLIRMALYGLFGEVYHPSLIRAAAAVAPSTVITYGLITGAVWGALWLQQRLALRSGVPAAGAVFDIRDGGRTLHAPVETILAVRSAGNYVEFQMADGRQILMRATLAQIEAELAAQGFARSHRGWLVNSRHITETRRMGAGDFELTLTGGLRAPLSRRWRPAVEAARGTCGA